MGNNLSFSSSGDINLKKDVVQPVDEGEQHGEVDGGGGRAQMRSSGIYLSMPVFKHVNSVVAYGDSI